MLSTRISHAEEEEVLAEYELMQAQLVYHPHTRNVVDNQNPLPDLPEAPSTIAIPDAPSHNVVAAEAAPGRVALPS